jgi:hypothetical protein
MGLKICIREDKYTIDTLEMIPHPKVDEIVEVTKVLRDEDGTFYVLLGYNPWTYDANCFRDLTLSDIEKIKNSNEIFI